MKKIFYFIFLISIAFACKKYPDGPLMSFRSFEKRLQGNWKVTELYSDDIDSLKYYNDSCSATMKIFKPYHDEGDYIAFYGKKEFHGRCGFIRNDKHKTLSVSLTNADLNHTEWCLGPIGDSRSSHWEILRLSNDEFKISTDFNGHHYQISFEKI
jgi:hypothetical protein